MPEQPQHRFHGKVRVQRGDTSIEVNIFDDTQETVYLEIQKALAQFSPDIKTAIAAEREIAKAGQAPAGEKAAPPAPAPKPASKPKSNGQVCPFCGAVGDIELIHWEDKDTGEPRSARKCQACKKWLN